MPRNWPAVMTVASLALLSACAKEPSRTFTDCGTLIYYPKEYQHKAMAQLETIRRMPHMVELTQMYDDYQKTRDDTRACRKAIMNADK